MRERDSYSILHRLQNSSLYFYAVVLYLYKSSQCTTITSHTIKTENSADAHSGDFKKYISEKAMDNNGTWHNVKLHGKNIKTHIFREPSTHRSLGSVSHDIQVPYKSQPS